MGGRGGLRTALLIILLVATATACDSTPELASPDKACRYISKAEARAAVGAPVVGGQSGTQDSDLNRTLCGYVGVPAGTVGGTVPALSVWVRKRVSVPDLPADGTPLNVDAFAKYPLGLGVGSRVLPAVIRTGKVAGAPALWYELRFPEDAHSESRNTNLNAFPPGYSVLVTVSDTHHNVTAAKKAARSVMRHLARA